MKDKTEINESLEKVFEDDFFSMIRETVHGDLTTAILSELQLAKEVWDKLSEANQKIVIGRVHVNADNIIRKLTRIIASEGFDSCAATVDSVTFKGGVKTSLKIMDRDGAHQLADHEGRSVMIVFADPGTFLNGADAPEADPDQADLVEESDIDPLFEEALAFVVETQKCSISSTQRKLRIGYNRAARIIDQLEAEGYVSEVSERGVRTVLIESLDDEQETEEESEE